MDRKQKIALVLNITILALVILGSVLCFAEIQFFPTKAYDHGYRLLKFFTLQSNLLAGIVALTFIIYLFKEIKTQKKIPFFVHILKYISTIDLVITFLVVALFLGFIAEDGYFSLYLNANFLFHFAIPVLDFVGFVFFEEKPRFRFRYTFLGLTHLFLYSIFYMINVFVHLHNGIVEIEHDWYAFAHFGIGLMFAFAVGVIGIGYLTSFALYKIINRRK